MDKQMKFIALLNCVEELCYEGGLDATKDL